MRDHGLCLNAAIAHIGTWGLSIFGVSVPVLSAEPLSPRLPSPATRKMMEVVLAQTVMDLSVKVVPMSTVLS